MPFKSARQERFMFAVHPAIAKRWASLYGNAPGVVSRSAGQHQRHHAADDYRNLTPSERSRHTPFRATEREATEEASGLVMPGGFPGPLGDHEHKGLRGRDVRAATVGRARKKGG